MNLSSLALFAGFVCVICGVAGVHRAYERRAAHWEAAAIAAVLIGVLLLIRFSPFGGLAALG